MTTIKQYSVKQIEDVCNKKIDEYKDHANYWLKRSIDTNITKSYQKEAKTTWDKYVTRIVAMESLLKTLKKEL